MRSGSTKLQVGAVAGCLVGRGAGLIENRTTLVPRVALRAGGGTAAGVLAGLYVEVPVIRPVWVVEGAEAVPDPLVRLQLELGGFVRPGDGGRPDRAQ